MNKYYTAKSYENCDRVGEPYENSKGKLVTKVKETCPRCGGLGLIISYVQNGQMIPVQPDGGICYQCNGAKTLIKEVRLYTEEERAALDKANERAKEKKRLDTEARMKREYEDNKKKWLSDNGFDQDGNTWVVTGDSYSIKNELKEVGFRYNKVLRWHAGSPLGYEDRTIMFNVNDLVQFTAWGKGEFLDTALDLVAAALKPTEEPVNLNSEYQGEVKERLRNIKAKCTRDFSFDGAYGITTVFTFIDEDENVYTWFTGSYQKVEAGDYVNLTGTVKAHNEYKGVKQTQLTRCKIEVL